MGVRRSDTAGYELRVLPNAHKWQYFRDPKGAAGPTLVASGSGKFIKLGSKANVLAIRAFSHGGTTTSVTRRGQRPRRAATTDTGADQPDGRQTVVTTGAKGSGAGTGISGRLRQRHSSSPEPVRLGGSKIPATSG